MVLDHLHAELRDVRDGMYTARRLTRDARMKVKSNPHFSQDLSEQAEVLLDTTLDSLLRVERLLRENMEPLLQRRGALDEDQDRLTDIMTRLTEVEDRLAALERGEAGGTLRAVR